MAFSFMFDYYLFILKPAMFFHTIDKRINTGRIVSYVDLRKPDQFRVDLLHCGFGCAAACVRVRLLGYFGAKALVNAYTFI